MCLFQGNINLSKAWFAQSAEWGRHQEWRGEINDPMAQLELSALAAKSSKEHWLDRRRLARKQVLNTQHTTSSSAMAHDGTLGRHGRAKATHRTCSPSSRQTGKASSHLQDVTCAKYPPTALPASSLEKGTNKQEPRPQTGLGPP